MTRKRWMDSVGNGTIHLARMRRGTSLSVARVLIVDDAELYATGLRHLLEETGRFQVTAIASRCKTSVLAAREEEPDVVFVSTHFRPTLVGRLERCAPNADIVLVHDDRPDIINIPPSLRVLSRRESSESALALIDSLSNAPAAAPHPDDLDAGGAGSLTDREREILDLLAIGMTSAEIAKRLYLATNTVRTYCQVLLSKLGARNRMHAVAIARDLGLV